MSFAYPFKSCFFKKVGVTCKKGLIEVLTYYGICYTFNMVASSEVYRESMYVVFRIKNIFITKEFSSDHDFLHKNTDLNGPNYEDLISSNGSKNY